MARDDNGSSCLLMGLCLVLVCPCLLVWNEFRYVWQYNAINYADQNAMQIPCRADDVPGKQFGSLVFASCPVIQTPNLVHPNHEADHANITDTVAAVQDLFIEDFHGTDLNWEVEIFQVHQHSHRRRGASYYFKQEWGEDAKPSYDDPSLFSGDTGEGQNLGNLPNNMRSTFEVADSSAVWIGELGQPSDNAFHLNPGLRRQILHEHSGPLFKADHRPTEEWPIAPRPFERPMLPLASKYLFVAEDSQGQHRLQTNPPGSSSQIGDIRIDFQLISPKYVSIMAKLEYTQGPGRDISLSESVQSGAARMGKGNYTAWEFLLQKKNFVEGIPDWMQTNDGRIVSVGAKMERPPFGFAPGLTESWFSSIISIGSYPVNFLYDGITDKATMINRLHGDNYWAVMKLRLAGWLGLTVGVCFLGDSAGELLGYIPLFGFAFDAAVQFGIYLLAPFISTTVSVLLISVAWFCARPLTASLILVVAVVVCLVLKKGGKVAAASEPLLP